VALDSLQPVGDLCDLLGVSRYSPGVFDAMVDILYAGSEGDAAGGRDARLANLTQRLTRRA
jgi:hypothetical protein